MSNVTLEDQRVTIRREFAAPVEQVYAAWTDPEKMARWFAPNVRWRLSSIDMDPRPGGRYDVKMNHLDGDVFHTVGTYQEVVPNERISFTWTWVGGPTGSEESLVTVELRAVAGGTELTLTHDRITDQKIREGTSQGWGGCLDMLESFLAGMSPLSA